MTTEVLFELNEKDFSEFHKYNISKNLTTKRIVESIILTGFMWALFPFFFINYLNISMSKYLLDYFTKDWYIVTFSFFIIFIIFYYFFGGIIEFKILKKEELRGKANITPEYLYTKSETSEFKYHWEKMDEIFKTENLFAFFIHYSKAIHLPKRCFNSEEEANNFYNTALEYWKAAKNN